ncbi:myo-inositol-1(or 4)-monophosphatase [Weissella beninensis]|nr:inositol monophosphatase family protein [Periweissella beninensis]MBM7544293.1 myo-inositol-1(or 4)-monophosphatase [Periweissella beninensis]
MMMEEQDLLRFDKTVQQWLVDIRQTLEKNLLANLLISEKKGRRDLVTNVDKNVEKILTEKIHILDPKAQILGEEGFGDAVRTMRDHVWFIDPIDGTMNFIKQRDDFAIMLALYIEGQGTLAWIMDVDKGIIYHGGPKIGIFANQQKLKTPQNIRLEDGLIEVSGGRLLNQQLKLVEIGRKSLGIRIIGSAGMSFIKVIEGKAVGYVSKMQPWDFAAAKVLLESLKMPFTTIDGTEIDMLSSNTVLTATPCAHQEIVHLELT